MSKDIRPLFQGASAGGNVNKLTTVIALVVGTLISSNTFAAKIKCEPAKFERIYTDNGNYFIQLEGMPWHLLGKEGEDDLDQKLNKIGKAQRRNKYIQLVFPDGYDSSCLVTDYSISVKKVKLKNNKDDV